MSTKTASVKSPSKTAKAVTAKANTASKTNKVKAATTPVVAPKAKSDRVEYGFELNFPNKPFTVKQLANIKHNTVKEITLYVRIQKALKTGVLEIAGKRVPTEARKGRQEILYRRTNVGAAVTSATPVAEVAAETAPVVEATPAVIDAPVTAEVAPVTA